MAGLMSAGGGKIVKSGNILGIYQRDSSGRMQGINSVIEPDYMSSALVFKKACKATIHVYISSETYLIKVSVSIDGKTIVNYNHSSHQSITHHTLTVDVNPGSIITVSISSSQSLPAVLVMSYLA